MDAIIDNYTEFVALLGNKITKELIGQQTTIENLLGKSIRLIKDKKILVQFEEKLKSEINTGKLDIFTIETEEKETIYKIVKRPDFLFGL